KCLGKMGDVAKKGRTVLFVSHNMQALSYFCPSTILLREGKVSAQDETVKVIEQYLSWDGNRSAEAFWSFQEALGTSVAKLRSVRALNEENRSSVNMWMNEPIILRCEFWILRRATVDVS